MREKLIELLREVQYQGNAVHGYHDKYIQNGELADHLIANGVTIDKDNNVPSKWIPVTERLPEKPGYYLCFVLLGGGYEGKKSMLSIITVRLIVGWSVERML